MAKTKISEWSATPANNTDIDGINIAEGCAPSGINDAIREMMAQVKDLYAGTSGDATAVAGGGTGATTASGARANLGVAIGTDVQAYDAELSTLAGMSSSRATYLASTEGFGFRNRIINGDMRIDQRNAGASVTISSTGTTYTLDRWKAEVSQASKISVQRNAGSVTPPNGHANYLGITSSSAYSVGSTDYFILSQNIEGFNVADLGWGTANAQTVTLSFWVRSSLTGTFGGVLYSETGNPSYPFTYTVSSANTWTAITITIPGSTTGTWATNNGIGLSVVFGLGAGSSVSGTAGVWASTLYRSATGATSVVGTSGATFYITGVQLEAGSVASPFERRDYGRELMMCQRYFAKTYNQSQAPGTSTGGVATIRSTSTGNAYGTIGVWTFPAAMRAVPTITGYAPGNGAAGSFNGDSTIYSQLGTHTPTEVGVGFYVNNNAIGANTFFSLHATASAEL